MSQRRLVRTTMSRHSRVMQFAVELLEDRTLLSSGIALNPTTWTSIGPTPIVNSLREPGRAVRCLAG